jgi:sirohydrochlorin ferrochelatase
VGKVEVAFLMGPDAATHRFQDQIAKLEKAGMREIVVVPLLVSSHSGHYEQLRWLAGVTDSLDSEMQHHLHMGGIDRPKTDAKVIVARALDDASQLADILSERALSLADSARRQALFLVGHGPNSAEDYAQWMKNLRRVAERVRGNTGFQDVRVDLVRDDAPAHVRAEAVLRIRELIQMQAQLTGTKVVVVPILISRSSVGDERIRTDLAGLPIVYSGEPLLPHALIARWIETRVQENVSRATRPD